MLEHGLGTWEEGDFRNHSQPSFKKGGGRLASTVFINWQQAICVVLKVYCI